MYTRFHRTGVGEWGTESMASADVLRAADGSPCIREWWQVVFKGTVEDDVRIHVRVGPESAGIASRPSRRLGKTIVVVLNIVKSLSRRGAGMLAPSSSLSPTAYRQPRLQVLFRTHAGDMKMEVPRTQVQSCHASPLGERANSRIAHRTVLPVVEPKG